MNFKKAPGTAALISGAVLLFLVLGGEILDSKYDLELTEYQLKLPRLPREFDGFRIVHLSDLHGMSFGAGNKNLLELIEEADPDIIVMTGDMAGADDELAALPPLLDGMSEIAPMYYVTGNHEWTGGCAKEVLAMMDKYHAVTLRNTYEPIYINDKRIIIAGVDDPKCPESILLPDEFAARLRKDCPEDFVLLLAHRNSFIRLYPDLPVELLLCGHAHGGLIRLPGIGGLINNDHSLMAEYEAGLYEGESYVMEVSRGLGNSVIVPRLFNRPELVAITLCWDEKK